jgi:phospholipase C
MDKIEHVVLLMLENRSFDSLLGWLYEKRSPARNVPSLRPGERAYDGLQGLRLQDYENVDATGTIRVSPIRGARGLNVPNIAPGESFAEVTTQLFGTEKPAASDKPTMKGYVRDYADLLRRHGLSEADVKRYADQVMQSHTPDQLPVINGLAEHYAVCDRWFSSVPSQTNPNRAFAFCGTSMGLVDNGFLEENPLAKGIESLVGYKLGDDRFHAPTIFNALHAGGNTTWKIFRESGLLQNNVYKLADIVARFVDPPSVEYLKQLSGPKIESDYTHRLFPQIQRIPAADSSFATLDNLDEFFAAALAGRLPNFTYIQPEWTIGERGTANGLKGTLFHQGDDYHPPGNLDAGETLVQAVYTALIRNRQAWEKTLLIITFDEPVGSFDHVPPPAAVPPWGQGTTPNFPREQDFRFDRYGGRVPAILVSPLIEKGTVFRSPTNVPFDHTSIISTILKWRGQAQRIAEFGERTKQAPTFDSIVSLSTPRTDEWDAPFMTARIARKTGDPVRFYDRFALRDPSGKYISAFQEREVGPWSVFSDDPSLSEYFPTLDYVDLANSARTTRFYCQLATNRPDATAINVGGDGVPIKLVATERGLGAYNVLGAWRDATDCYYFNDYLEGDNNTRQIWTLRRADRSGGPLRFGDKVVLENKYFGQVLAPHGGSVTTVRGTPGSAVWTIEPISVDRPDPGSLAPASDCYVRHVKSGRYVTKVYKGAQWYPTLGTSGERVKLHLQGDMRSRTFVDGMAAQLLSATEDLNSSGKRCDQLMAWTNPYLYYYYHDYSADYQTWIISLVAGAGVIQSGSKVRLINKGYGQFMAPKEGYLTTVTNYSDECDWVLEKV